MMTCKDTWKTKIPDYKLAAYKALIDKGLIRNQRVTYMKQTGITIVEYESDCSHAEILNELKARSGRRSDDQD